MTTKDGDWIPTNRAGVLRYTGDLRLILGTPEQIAATKRQIEKRSLAAKAGWAKRRAPQELGRSA